MKSTDQTIQSSAPLSLLTLNLAFLSSFSAFFLPFSLKTTVSLSLVVKHNFQGHVAMILVTNGLKFSHLVVPIDNWRTGQGRLCALAVPHTGCNKCSGLRLGSTGYS